ncbi:MAG: hypothetical protein R3Y56_09725, partial [Akkermansia sp.]
ATLTIMLSQYTTELLSADIDLGISSSIDADQISVFGYDEDAYTLTESSDGTWLLNVNGAMPDTSALWDQNWGEEVLSGSPDNLITITSDESINLGSSEYAYDVDGVATVSIIFSGGGTEDSPITLVGGYNSDDGNSATLPDESDVWIMVTGGYLETVIGANVANNWGDGSTIFNYTGDTHIMYTGGEVGTIIGGLHRDGDANTATGITYTGNTYISLYDVVTGAVIGGNTSTHNGTSNFVGDTNIYIYVPQSYADTASDIGSITGFKGIVGGSACIVNGYCSMVITGDTNITVDLSEYELTGGDEDTFTYVLIGGSYCANESATTTINGDTNINVTSISGVTFSNALVGASYVSGTSASSTVENSTVTIDGTLGGTFSSFIIGGSYGVSSTGITSSTSSNVVINTGSDLSFSSAIYGGDYNGSVSSSFTSNDTSVTISGDEGATFSGFIVGNSYGYANCSGTASIDISGGSTFSARVIGGSYATSLGATLMSGNVDIDISGGTFSADVIGGNYNASSYTSSSTNYNTVGDISIDISGGTFSSYIYGGSYINQGNISTDTCYTTVGDINITISGDASLYYLSGGSYLGAAATVEQGNISITLEGGSISGNIYAAGLADANQSATWTTESTSVTVGSAFTFGDASIVSGGYRLTNNSVTSEGRTITNGSTLNFSDEDTTYSNLSTTTFSDFDTVYVASGAIVDLSAMTTVESLDATLLTKTGAGSLTLASSTGSVSVEGGTLSLGSSSSMTDLSVDAGASLIVGSSSTVSGNITLSGGSLTLTSFASVSCAIQVNAASNLSTSGTNLTLNSTITFADLADDGSFNTLDLTGCGNISLGDAFAMDFTDVSLVEGSYEILSGLDSSFSASSITEELLVGLDESDYSDYYLTWDVVDNSLVLTLTERGDAIYWDGVDGSTWVAGGNAWDDGNDSTKIFSNEMSVIFDDGADNKSVVVDDAGVSVASMTIDNSDYSFSGGGISVAGSLYLTNGASASFSNSIDLSTASVNIATGSSLSLGADITIESLSNSGSLSVGEYALTLSEATSSGGDITAASLTLSASGSYVFGNVQLTGDLDNDGDATVTLGDGTNIAGDYSGGPLVISAGAEVTIGSNTAGIGSLSVGEGAELSMGAKLYVGTTSFTNLGTITTTGDVQIACSTTEGGTISGVNYTLSGSDYTFTSLTATGDVEVSGSLSLTAGGSITGALTASSLSVGDSGLSVGSLSSTSLSTLSNGSGTLIINGGNESTIDVSELSNSGTIDAAGYSMNVSDTSVEGGVLKLANLTTAGTVSLAGGSAISGNLSTTGLSTTGDVTVGSLSSTSLSTLSNGTGT